MWYVRHLSYESDRISLIISLRYFYLSVCLISLVWLCFRSLKSSSFHILSFQAFQGICSLSCYGQESLLWSPSQVLGIFQGTKFPYLLPHTHLLQLCLPLLSLSLSLCSFFPHFILSFSNLHLSSPTHKMSFIYSSQGDPYGSNGSISA